MHVRVYAYILPSSSARCNQLLFDMRISEVLELLPHIDALERLRISELSVQPLHIGISCAERVQIPVAAIRFTHDTVKAYVCVERQ